MALDTEIKAQLGQYLELLESDVVFKASLARMKIPGKSASFCRKLLVCPRKSLSKKQL